MSYKSKAKKIRRQKGFPTIIDTFLFGVFGEVSAKENRKICTWTEFNGGAQNLIGSSAPESLLGFEKDSISWVKFVIALANYNQLDLLLINSRGSTKSALAEGLYKVNPSRDYNRTNRPVIIFLRDSWEMFVNNYERLLDII